MQKASGYVTTRFFYLRRFVYCIVQYMLQCSFTKTEMRFRRKKLLDNPYAAFPYFVSTAHEKAFPDLRIFLRLYGPMHSRIAFLADSYVAMLHNRYVRTYIHTYMGVTCRINYDRGTADAMSHGPISFIRRGTGPRRSSCNFEDCATAHDDDRQWHRRAIDFRFRLETAASKINDVSWLVSRSVSNESAGESPTWSPRNLATEIEKNGKP